MNLIDILILLFVIAIISLIIFFNIKSHKTNEGHCSKCPYNKCCKSKEVDNCKKDKEKTN